MFGQVVCGGWEFEVKFGLGWLVGQRIACKDQPHVTKLLVSSGRAVETGRSHNLRPAVHSIGNVV